MAIYSHEYLVEYQVERVNELIEYFVELFDSNLTVKATCNLDTKIVVAINYAQQETPNYIVHNEDYVFVNPCPGVDFSLLDKNEKVVMQFSVTIPERDEDIPKNQREYKIKFNGSDNAFWMTMEYLVENIFLYRR